MLIFEVVLFDMITCNSLLCFFSGTYYTIDKYLSLKDDSSANTDVKFVASLDYYKNLSKTWLALGKSSS